MHLANFDIDRFLREYWQQKPLLIRNAWDSWANPLDPDELAGLACEEGIEARLIRLGSETWRAEHGPFPEERFAKPDKLPWTLLVQAVDHHVPEVAALIEPFRFLPNWRIEDVMVSYATDQGGVGPHFDQYDVFLVQGLGRRRWQLGGLCDQDSEMLPHDDLRLLANFEPLEEWILEPGDILYVPPRIAHNGMAIGDDCMTYSVGFRAPSRSDLVAGWSEHLLGEEDDDDRYSDPGLSVQANPGEIRADALAALHALVTGKLDDRQGFARWFGQFTTTRKYPDIDWSPEEPASTAQLEYALAAGQPLCRNPASRFSYIEQAGGEVLLFVDGQCTECGPQTAAFARQLCASADVAVDEGRPCNPAVLELITVLYNQGSVAFVSAG